MMINLEALVKLPEFEALKVECNQETSFRKFKEYDCGWVGGMTGIHGSVSYSVHAMLRMVLRQLSSGNFLDLGFGDGSVVIDSAREGWRAYGIDFCRNCYTFANENILAAEREGYIAQETTRLALGNFFPQWFVRETGQGDGFRDQINAHPAISGNPYEILGIKLHEIDVFYHYQVERADNILHLFSEYAKAGARLFFVRTLSDTVKPLKGIAIESSLDYLGVIVYQKKHLVR